MRYDSNCPVITTKYIIYEKYLITDVYIDSDGDWQFLGSQEAKEEDVMIVSLEQIIKRDSSIMELLDMPLNSHAYRGSSDDKWQIESYEVQ